LNLACSWFWWRRFFKMYMYFYSFGIISHWKRATPFEQTWIPFTQEWFVSSLVKIGQMVLEKIFKWPHPIFTFCNYLPFEEHLALSWNKLEFSSPKDNLYRV
jgi:hypothetical protein